MTDKPQNRGIKILLWALTSPVTLILGLLLLYYGSQAYVFGNSPWQNKMIMAGIVVVWILWLVFKNLIKFLLLALVAGSLFYAYYRYENRDQIACKAEGRVWNQEKRLCEDKLGWKEELESLWQKYFKEKKDQSSPVSEPKAEQGTDNP